METHTTRALYIYTHSTSDAHFDFSHILRVYLFRDDRCAIMRGHVHLDLHVGRVVGFCARFSFRPS